MYESGNEAVGETQEYIEYVPGDQILEETVVDGLIDVDHIDTVIEPTDGYGYVNVKIDDASYTQTQNKRKYRMRQRAPAVTHYCQQCDKHIKYPSKIQEHMRKHTGEKPYMCTICGSRFSQGHVLTAHLRGHQGERPFKCSYCDRCFSTVAHRNAHEKALHPGILGDDGTKEDIPQGQENEPSTSQMLYICPVEECGYQNHVRVEVEEHLAVFHNFELEDVQEVQEDHLWTEYPPDDISSSGQELNDAYQLYSHEHDMNQIDPNMEEPGPSSSRSKIDILEDGCSQEAVPPSSEEIEIDSSQFHMSSSKMIDSVTEHMVEQFDTGLGEYDDAVFEEESVSVMCDPNPPKRGKQQSYAVPKTMVEMDARVVEMIGPKPVGYRPRKSGSKPPRNLDWIIDAVAKGHDVDMSSPHNRKKPKIHTCQFCGKVDKYPSKILAHLRTHTGEKPYKCTICGMGFSQRTPMRLHMRRHLDHKPFCCPWEDCEERFVSGALRNLHVNRKHLKERKYVCMKGCGRCFASSKNQRHHEERCFYNKDEFSDPVYQQLLYDEDSEDNMFDSEEPMAQEDVDDKWDPRMMGNQMEEAEEHQLDTERAQLLGDDVIQEIYLEHNTES